ncbi:hypothetical protein RvY_11539-2 [Ramazzottius varieornatus]|uniref:DUF4371 domain-containing protein n=1 Tax=Ramazzottius varieornatus TaxID=947166 RepID=A0A1D1VP80_RAMVA|nr:hypothetical protein RvY_11539-2 [Ramazzottius varieornatus]
MDVTSARRIHGYRSALGDQRVELRRVLLDFVDLPAEQSAENLKNSVLTVLRDYDIARKTLGYTMDGAANMTAFFEDILPELRMERESHGVKNDVSEFKLRCICHVVNTVCQVGVVDEKNLIG